MVLICCSSSQVTPGGCQAAIAAAKTADLFLLHVSGAIGKASLRAEQMFIFPAGDHKDTEMLLIG